MRPFSTAEIVVYGSLIAGIDGICAIIDLTGVGIILAAPLQLFLTWGMEQVQKSHGSTSLGKLTPKRLGKYFASALPTGNFFVFIVSAVLHNRIVSRGATQ